MRESTAATTRSQRGGVPDAVARDALVARLSAMGYPPVEPESPYWTRQGVTVEGPDGWRVVLQNTRGIGP